MPELEYDTRIEPAGDKSTIHWSVKVPTGGWTMTLDQPPLIEERNTLVWARVYITVEAPNPSDMVTQAFTTLTGSFQADRKVDRVELSARRKTKGVETGFAPAYSVVKTGSEVATPQDKPN